MEAEEGFVALGCNKIDESEQKGNGRRSVID